MVLFLKNSMQIHHCSFGGEGSAEPNSCFKSKADLVSIYAKKQMQSSEEAKNLIPRVRGLMNQKTLLISTRDVERNTLKFFVVNDKKLSEMEVKLDKISVPDKIHLHKQTGDVIYSDLLHAIMRFNKLQGLVDKMEVQMKHEKVENKANLIHI